MAPEGFIWLLGKHFELVDWLLVIGIHYKEAANRHIGTLEITSPCHASYFALLYPASKLRVRLKAVDFLSIYR